MCPCRPAANYSKLVHRALLVRQCVLVDQQQTTVSLYTEQCLSGNVSLSTSSKLQQACTQSIACQAMCPCRPAANYSKLVHRALLVRQCVLVDQQQTTVSLHTEHCLSGNVSLSTNSKGRTYVWSGIREANVHRLFRVPRGSQNLKCPWLNVCL